MIDYRKPNNNRIDISVSIVIYENTQYLYRSIHSCLNSPLQTHIYIIDNSKNPSLDEKHLFYDRVEYIKNEKNIGYGAANNIALQKSIFHSKYHLVLNPDVYFEPGCLESLFEFMETNIDVGLIMPKIINLDGSDQHLCRLLPNPLNLFLRRFSDSNHFSSNNRQENNLIQKSRNKISDVAFLSGCFMLLRSKSLQEVGLFDERYFMYMEDVDLCRRIIKKYRNVFYPFTKAYHAHTRGSYNNTKLLYYHIISAIRYFNKWGWIFDPDRKSINESILHNL